MPENFIFTCNCVSRPNNQIFIICRVICNFRIPRIYSYVPVGDIYRGGVAPRVRAERPPGQWQSYHVWFQAPRFDDAGNKVANAKFLRVLHNGVLIHENVEREGPTQAPLKIPEAAENPLMLQGDHEQIAYRNIYVRPLRPVSR